MSKVIVFGATGNVDQAIVSRLVADDHACMDSGAPGVLEYTVFQGHDDDYLQHGRYVGEDALNRHLQAPTATDFLSTAAFAATSPPTVALKES